VYGDRDAVDLTKVAGLGLPFWLAGGMGWPDRLAEALACGAAGVQVGTLFAYCEESGLARDARRAVIDRARAGRVGILTHPDASPTGYPFKVAQLPGTLSDEDVFARRRRICDLGYLRTACATRDGRIVMRCPAEPVRAHVAKGGDPAATVGRRCLCNALMANVGVGQVRSGKVEPMLLTSGDDLGRLGEFLAGRDAYTAADVLRHVGA
jgi:NAD(P)H-dependent flavin oxidoreductase YrpB (nitropropane dioxygenase family)